MAKGAHVPSGVNYYDGRGRPDSTKGKHHPKSIGAGLENTKKLSGSVVSVPKPPSGSATFPAGVSRGDGTERRRGTNYKTMRGNVGAGPGGSAGNSMSHVPGRVTKTDGKRGKRSIVNP